MTATAPQTMLRAIAEALDAWRLALGDEQVVLDTARYNVDTSSRTGQMPVALCPRSLEQVQQVVRIAQRFGAPISPLSTGHNWGYGTSVPVTSPSAIVDLSGLDRIVAFDAELGVVTLEPGVTQGALSAFLQARALPFLVPVTGGGPSCSVLANALERGFGVTPLTDHFGALLSMKVVLPDGELYESYGRACNAAGVAQAFKWGTGPYFDGLFSQSNLGLVVEASIALQPLPERHGALLFIAESDAQVERATAGMRQLLTSAGHNVGAINLMSRSRVESMLQGAQRTRPAARRQVLPPGAWFGFGSVYGTRAHYRATCQLARDCLRGALARVRVYGPDDLRRLRFSSRLAAALGWPQAGGAVERLAAALGVVAGVPSTFALPLAYAHSGQVGQQADLNPARDRCGLFWYAPIVPLRSGVVGQFVEFAQSTCARHGLPAPITLTSLSPRCYASTLPLLFDPAQPDSERRARACFEDLRDTGLKLGFMPYRLGAEFMPGLARHAARVAPLARAIKTALDPAHVLAPGRYSFE